MSRVHSGQHSSTEPPRAGADTHDTVRAGIHRYLGMLKKERGSGLAQGRRRCVSDAAVDRCLPQAALSLQADAEQFQNKNLGFCTKPTVVDEGSNFNFNGVCFYFGCEKLL